MSSTIRILTREDLHRQVWATSMTRLAAEFDVSPNVLRMLSLSAGIPLPGSGYWSRRRSGKGPPPPLRPRPPGAAAIITIGAYETWWRRQSEMLGEPIPPEPQFPETVEEVVAQVLASAPDRHSPRRDVPPARRQGRQDRLVGTLGEILAPLQIELRHESAPSGELRIRCHTRWLKVRIIAAGPPRLPGQRLELVLEPGPGHAVCAFADTAGANVEDQIGEIVVAILSAAESDYRVAACQHHRWCLERRRDAERDARERRTKARNLLRERREAREDARRRLLYSQADAWRTARDIRGLVAEVMASADDAGSASGLAGWADWARAEADALDPLLNDTLVPPDP